MMRQLLRAAGFAIVLVGTGCVATVPEYDPFKISKENFYASIQTIAVAPVKFPEDLENRESVAAKFEILISGRLREMGYSVVPSSEFAAIWDQMTDQIGGYFDSVTGKRDETKFRSVRAQTFQELQARFAANAVLFPAFVVVKVKWSNYVARWDGAVESLDSRPGWVQFLDTSMTSGTIGALSLRVVIEDAQGSSLFANQGGFRILSRFGGSFLSYDFVPVLEDELYANEERNVAAVETALRPLVQ